MRINIDNQALPGVQSERVMPLEGEQERENVFVGRTLIGAVVYVARRRKAPAGSASSTGFVTDYGWRPAGASRRSRLLTKVEATRLLARLP